VPRGSGFPDPIAYGIDDSGTEGKLPIGAWAISAALRVRLRNNLSQLQLVVLVDGWEHPAFRFHCSMPLKFVLP
jgi:hypothetical protein